MNQQFPTQFQSPPITGVQHIPSNTSSDTPLLGKGNFDLEKFLPLLLNLTIQDDTLTGLENTML